MLSVGDSARLQRQAALLRALPAADMGTSEGERAAILDLLGAAQRLAEAREEKARRRSEKQIDGEGAGAFPRLGAFRPVRIAQSAVVDDPARPPSSFAVTFPQGVVWGLAGCVMAFVTSLSVERSRGTLRRLCAAPLSMHMVLASKALACFSMALVMQVMLMVLAVTAFGVRPVQPAMLLPAMVAIAVAFTMVAMAIAALFQSLGGSEGAGRSVILILALLGGGSVPLAFMPPALASASAVSPFRWAIAALEGPLWRGGSMPSQLAAIGAVLLVALIAAAVAWCALSFRRSAA
jgi:ABC-2 type transport system permease protein